jgi:RNA polymerase sigma factor (sigma-70 family)
MAWNNGLERKKFEAEQEKLAAEYRAAGMSEEQIQQMHEFDLEVFNSNRRFAEHTQEFPESPFEDGDEGQSPLYERFPEALTVSMELPIGNWRYAWIDELEDEQLAKELKSLSVEDIELITLYAFEERSQEEISKQFGISQRAVSKRIEKLRKFFKKFF